ncbi:MAG: hypothetical protein HOK83_08195, partial [Rhodospirillaceae bacterium]|nr:hypothetical protein [Rhodospirillaceae bacterium]
GSFRVILGRAGGADTDLVADMTAYEELQRFPPAWITSLAFRARIAHAQLTARKEA